MAATGSKFLFTKRLIELDIIWTFPSNFLNRKTIHTTLLIIKSIKTSND